MFNHKFSTGDTVEYGNYRVKILTVIQKRDKSVWYEIEGVDDASRRKVSTLPSVVPEDTFEMNDDQNYVLVSHNHEIATYYAGFDGSYVFTDDVRKAVRFTVSEIAEIIKENQLSYLGITIVRIENCTFEKLEHDEALREKYYRNFVDVVR